MNADNKFIKVLGKHGDKFVVIIKDSNVQRQIEIITKEEFIIVLGEFIDKIDLVQLNR